MRVDLCAVYDSCGFPVVVAVEEYGEPEWGLPLPCPLCLHNRGGTYYLSWGERRCDGDPTTGRDCSERAAAAVDVLDDNNGWTRRTFCRGHAPDVASDRYREPAAGGFGHIPGDRLEVACGKCRAEFPALAAGLVSAPDAPSADTSDATASRAR